MPYPWLIEHRATAFSFTVGIVSKETGAASVGN